ncbi:MULTISPECIES: sigma-54-dependent transcriptional regulator [Desulfobacula]|uniref:Two component system response regulator, sigma54-specific n=2 Tax=Desulfobacula TaxID=28222 RepID=K0NIP5_DESTT|nr:MULTISPECIES: sigma-54 dependent transcriptional regulator [Desulfobacula]CCK81296.1 two component system response regulator, sigma54-specific [Desulfobacula toluolica Tol2]SDU61173.1 DNA-binding transcriptional response regulator, NtrC family, contains REC, AAA-type ATPase, and a Fis-type DNA-binding domains [Desulfobacula phenolica]
MIKYSIAIVDDEEIIRDALDITLSDQYDIILFESAESFLASLEQQTPDLVLMDIGLPIMTGIEALEILKQKHNDIPVIMITAYEDINMVIRSMKIGAFDFILKPINLDILELTIQKAISSIALIKEVKILQEKYLQDNLPCFIGESKNIENVMDFINMVSKSSDTPIMILGETGTGKELIAKAIHARSPVFQGPFIPVNCSAFPEDLIESELFGYESGAFSGASSQGKKGFIEEADGGTLFLDEVADLSLAGQAKLLRFLEDGEFYKVGGTKRYHVRTRVVSATNKKIDDLVDEEKFRKDLYFRLCVIKAEVPSLNERKEDILPLAKHFLHEFNKKFSKTLKGFSKDAENHLLSYEFTGNARELKNMVERAVLISKTDRLELDKLKGAPTLINDTPPLDIKQDHKLGPEGIDLDQLLETTEKKYMEQALEFSKGNESKAARLLNMNHHTFRYRWKKISKK